MLNIDCLLKNTEYIDGVKKYVKYLGNLHAENGENASFSHIYNKLRKDGLEVDIDTAAHIYLDQLPTETDDNFTKREKVEEIAGREFNETTKNLILSDPKTGEKTIGDLSPKKSIAKRLADTFRNNVVEDHTTKSILKTIQDMYTKTLDRYTGDLPNQKEGEPKREFEQIFSEALDKMNVGHRDTETGLINNLKTLHDGVREELKKLTDKYEAEGDYVKAAQWKQYVEHFENSVYDAALSTKESKEAIDSALKSEGYMTTDKNGNAIPDYDKLAGTVNTAEQLRNHVVDAMVKSGKFDKDTAEKIADSMHREYVDIVANRLRSKLDKEQARKQKSWEPPVKKEKIKVDDVVADQVKRWETYIGHEERGGELLVVSRKTAADALKHVLTESGLTRENKKGEPTIDLDKVSQAISSPKDIKQISKDYFADQKNDDGTPKYTADKVDRISNAIEGMYTEMFNKVREHVEGKQAAIEKTWEDPSATAQPKTIGDIISKRLKDISQFRKITGRDETPLKFTKNEAQKIVGEVLKNTKEYGKETRDGKKTISWLNLAEKRPTQEELQSAIQQHMVDNEHFSKSDAKDVAESLARDYHGLLNQAISDHALATLKMKESAIDKDAPERKTAIQRLAELNSLGIFEGGQEKLLSHVLGIDQHNAEDLDALKEIAKSATDLRNELGGKDYLGSLLFKHADRIVNHIIERNKDNPAKVMRITKAINHTFEVMNMGLISNPYNMVENNWSGLQAIIGANIELRKEMGLKINPVSVLKEMVTGGVFTDSKLWWNVWKDVAIGGVELGGAGEKWSHIGGFADNMNTLNFKKHPLQALKTMAIIMPRAMLNASDAANKAVLAKKGMMYSLHQAMVSSGWDSDVASQHIYEAMYGENYENAKEKASILIGKYGDKFGLSTSEYARKRQTERLANDLVIANLNMAADPNLQTSRPIVDDKMIEAAMESGYHAAAVSLGHEPNNPLSRMLKSAKQEGMQRENKLLDQAKNATDPKRKQALYSQAARARLINNLWFNGVLRMQSGAANWAVLRAQSLGIGLATRYGEGGLKTTLDFDSKEKLAETMKERIKSQRNITRALTGMTATTMGLAAMATYGMFRTKQQGEEEDEGVMDSAAKGIKGSYILNRAMNKFGPDMAQLYYQYRISKGDDQNKAIHATLEYTTNLLNSDPSFTIGGKLTDAMRKTAKGGDKNKAYALGELGQIYGDMVQVPFYKSGEQFYELINHAVTGEEIKHQYTKPKHLFTGAFGGGIIQGITSHLFSPEQLKDYGMEEWIPKQKQEEEKVY